MPLRTVGAIGGGLVLVVMLVAIAAVAGLASLVGLGSTTSSSTITPSGRALADIPPEYLQTYQAAAATCPGLPWTVLAGIGEAETGQGRNTQISSAGAEGPMQFEPATFAEYGAPVPPGGINPPTPFDPVDAIYAATRLLCANGARDGANIPGAIYAYNHDQSYVTEVLSYAAAYGAPDPTSTRSAAATAISYAAHQIGTPYLWGGETPGVGFDCSGLTQGAYKAAGIAIPRTSEEQWLALPHVPLDGLQPGDLVFFNPGEDSPGLPGHVGIYLGNDEMVDAPYTGVDVRIDGLGGTQPFGAARPGG
ncbi:MAG TPA: bifunctional lytic transglycosylase/C40 family peptidase [Acidimicrobiales bacterium]|jgi:cell wall-associated NlpC family hydrolase|nr:bifunctional lytic transglycosylase/C40 family peptidase [Acidimicrobiales bacterium]